MKVETRKERNEEVKKLRGWLTKKMCKEIFSLNFERGVSKDRRMDAILWFTTICCTGRFP